MPRDFYVVLGVSRDADLSQIRRAYKRLVRRYHPDTGTQPSEHFIEVRKAYETLKDDEARREYDRMHANSADNAVPVRVTAPSSTMGRVSAVSPSASRSCVDRVSPGVMPASLWATPVVREPRQMLSAADEFFGGFVPGLFTTGRMSSRHKDLYVELILSSDEARDGGLYDLQVPVHEVCSSCGGSGFYGLIACPECRGQSVRYPELKLSVPPRVADGTQVRLDLDDIGLSDVFLNVTVSVR
jgi:molecular chaperone DnaJ